MSFIEEMRAAFTRGETDEVERMSRAELSRARENSDPAGEINALYGLAAVAMRAHDATRTRQLGEEALAVALRTGDRSLEEAPRHMLAGAARMAGDVAAARVLYEESIALNESLGNEDRAVRERHNLGWMELHSKDVDRARELFAAVRLYVARNEYREFIPYAVLDAAAIAVHDGAYRQAARLLAVVTTALADKGRLDPDDAIEYESLWDRLVAELGRDTFDDEYAGGLELVPLEALTSGAPSRFERG
jgi:tetratricopeptide (TPR) repeat protein